MKKRKSALKGTSSNTELSKNDGVSDSRIFDNWSLIHRDPHPESQDIKARAANQRMDSMDLKFG
ncbi:hypothetical protein [Legionella sp. W05-934-2]|jgi:hypothetical protein|uniref:hypothetical protein n=1 Tax=Legionella sp. W05-934-2 TaxID=1198649 RepID=UPI00346365F5